MQILHGLQSHQVLQRNAKDVCQVRVSGRSGTAGIIYVRVIKDGRCLKGFNNKSIAKVGTGTFSMQLTGIPVGGPYTICLRLVQAGGKIDGEATFENVLVGDVWILAGQSNMEGVGRLKHAAKPHPLVRAFCMDDRWAVAEDPIHALWIAVDRVHADINKGPFIPKKHLGTGPGVAFGRQMYEYTKVPQGLICCAHGGTNMSQWDPSLKKKGGASLYGAMMRRFIQNGSNVAGVVWYQGCSDGFDDNSRLYTKRMKKFIASVRRDLGSARLPFVMVQIAGVYWDGQIDFDVPKTIPHWNSVQEQQRNLPKLMQRLAVIPAIDLSYDDAIHIGGVSQNRLGRRLARAAMVVTKGLRSGLPPIELRTMRVVRDKVKGLADIEVSFANVEGMLKSEGKANGFSIVNADGRVYNCIFRVDLQGNRAILRTNMEVERIPHLLLHYGWGLTPYCNITDAADRSLPVFGPIILPKCK